jgi:CheY-like chemotaxis protein
MAQPSILLADDDENDVLIMQRAFKMAQIANPLVIARNGEEVISILSGGNGHQDDKVPVPAVLLLDLKMPRKNGFEVLAWIRQQPSLNRLIVVVMTSSREYVDVRKAYDLHANSFIVKRSNIDLTAEMLKCLHSYWFVWNESPDLVRSGYQSRH